MAIEDWFVEDAIIEAKKRGLLTFYCRGCGLPVPNLRMVWHPECRKLAKRLILADKRQRDRAKFATRASRMALRAAKHQEKAEIAT